MARRCGPSTIRFAIVLGRPVPRTGLGLPGAIQPCTPPPHRCATGRIGRKRPVADTGGSVLRMHRLKDAPNEFRRWYNVTLGTHFTETLLDRGDDSRVLGCSDMGNGKRYWPRAITAAARSGSDNRHDHNGQAAARCRFFALVGGALPFPDFAHMGSVPPSSGHINLAIRQFVERD